jgi:heat-inducible transcriptional repressor
MAIPFDSLSVMQALDQRSRSIFREIVELYLETGEPVGSRTLSRRGVSLSPASIRNVMSDLVDLGLIESPHTSAGRAPTHSGLRLFVDGFMQVGEPSDDDKASIDAALNASGRDMKSLLESASDLLSGLTGGASLVSSPTHDSPIRQVDFVPLRENRALAILVFENGDVENRIFILPEDLPATALIEAGNFLNARMKGKSLSDAIAALAEDMQARRAELDARAATLVEQGIAEWSGEDPVRGRSLIVKGHSNLLEDARNAEDLNRVRQLFDELERRESLLNVLDRTREGEGLRLFIGAENKLFSLSGSSLIVAPYMSAERRIMGALGVIGPVRLNYARVIPMVDYTARLIGDIAGGGQRKDER